MKDMKKTILTQEQIHKMIHSGEIKTVILEEAGVTKEVEIIFCPFCGEQPHEEIPANWGDIDEAVKNLKGG
jgi:hypothetical protein